MFVIVGQNRATLYGPFKNYRVAQQCLAHIYAERMKWSCLAYKGVVPFGRVYSITRVDDPTIW